MAQENAEDGIILSGSVSEGQSESLYVTLILSCAIVQSVAKLEALEQSVLESSKSKGTDQIVTKKLHSLQLVSFWYYCFDYF